MAAASSVWEVHPHEPIQELADNLWCVQGAVRGIPLKRRMTLARLADGKLLIHNPVALEEDAMKRIEAWGPPAYIVVPGAYHRLDCARFKARYPDAKVVCPSGAKARVEGAVPVELTYPEVPKDERVGLEELDGVARVEGVMRVETGKGATLVFNDLLFNVPRLPGFMGFVMKLLGSTGGPRVTPVSRFVAVKDKAALRAHYERLANAGPTRLIPGHGDLIEENAAEVLRQVAARL